MHKGSNGDEKSQLSEILYMRIRLFYNEGYARTSDPSVKVNST